VCFAPQRALTALQTARSQLACATYNGLPGGLATLVHTEIQKGREALRGALGDGAAAGVQRTATHCNALQRTATHCNALQRTATHHNALQRTTTHCAATHCNAPQRSVLEHTAIHCTTLQHTRGLRQVC